MPKFRKLVNLIGLLPPLHYLVLPGWPERLRGVGRTQNEEKVGKKLEVPPFFCLT